MTFRNWIPDPDDIPKTNLFRFMQPLGFKTVAELHAFSVQHIADFWQRVIDTLTIVFKKPPTEIVSYKKGLEYPEWLVNARFNIVDSCFTATPESTALVYLHNHELTRMSYGTLEKLVNRVANGLVTLGFQAGDAIAINMPMTVNAIAIYLGIIKMGGVVVSIADSFSSEEIAVRLRIAHTKAIFTQDVIVRREKKLPLYEKVIAAKAPRAIVLSCTGVATVPLRKNDMAWENFISSNEYFDSVSCTANTHCNILFSSGTTADPKAIPWNHSTAIKCASDAFFHHNIQPQHVVAWPTNLGWMMGPWLIFATLINQAAIAVYDDAPHEKKFGDFIQHAKVTLLGVVPTLVAEWRKSGCMEQCDWHAIQAFSSSGECSNADDMRYLMTLAGGKPIIEYCGGTEIGGAYLTSTLLQENIPTLFSTPAMGIDIVLLNEQGQETNQGEIAIKPPSIGLSTELVNADHHQIYFENMPNDQEGHLLRRHGDQGQRLPSGYFQILGRIDDTMNLGGIKTSAAEIERAFSGMPDILETAAIAVPINHQGPDQLIIYVVLSKRVTDKTLLKKSMQEKINTRLNPLFKIHDIHIVDQLPKTASNKIMRRTLRKNYLQSRGNL